MINSDPKKFTVKNVFFSQNKAVSFLKKLECMNDGVSYFYQFALSNNHTKGRMV